MKSPLKEIDKVEIVSLQDNYIDVLAMDTNNVVQRPFLVKPLPDKGFCLSSSPIAEHGFSTYITVTENGEQKSMLFDFGCSDHGATFNAELLGIDLTKVEALALSHGHMDHFGGMKELVRRINKGNLELVLHPAVFKENRYVKIPTGAKIYFPLLTRDDFRDAGLAIRETTEPLSLLDEQVLFLGEIPRISEFEEGMKNAFYERDGLEAPDIIEDDTSLVFNIKGKGLVVLTGCAHSGIINTVNHARKVTGIDKVFVVMGGFHLTGPAFADKITPTIDALMSFSPQYVVPAHCTGREATLEIERRMPDQFILNMSATTLVFSTDNTD